MFPPLEYVEGICSGRVEGSDVYLLVYCVAYLAWKDLVASSRVLNAVPLALALSANALSAADNSIFGLLVVVAVEPELPHELERGVAAAELEPQDEPEGFGVELAEEPQDEPEGFGAILGVEREGLEPQEEPELFGAEYEGVEALDEELPQELEREPPPLLKDDPPLREPPPKLPPLALAARTGAVAVAKTRAIVKSSFFIVVISQSAD